MYALVQYHQGALLGSVRQNWTAPVALYLHARIITNFGFLDFRMHSITKLGRFHDNSSWSSFFLQAVSISFDIIRLACSISTAV